MECKLRLFTDYYIARLKSEAVAVITPQVKECFMCEFAMCGFDCAFSLTGLVIEEIEAVRKARKPHLRNELS